MTDQKIERPETATDDVLEYLDELRESGVTNMYGAGSYLRDEFNMDTKKNTFAQVFPMSHEVLGYWMKTFAERHGLDDG
jgi:hypothetical protein